MTRARVLVADDHAPTREDIGFALSRSGAFEVCAEVADAAAAVRCALEERPDVALLDVRMPGGGIRAAAEIATRLPGTRVVMLTVSDDNGDLFAALRAGADGYLLKDMDPRNIPRALDSVLAGQVAIPRALVGRLVDRLRDPNARRRSLVGDGPEAELTSREWQVLDLLRDDLSTAEIAERLTLSPVTVRTHVQAIVRKLGLSDRSELRSR